MLHSQHWSGVYCRVKCTQWQSRLVLLWSRMYTGAEIHQCLCGQPIQNTSRSQSETLDPNQDEICRTWSLASDPSASTWGIIWLWSCMLQREFPDSKFSDKVTCKCYTQHRCDDDQAGHSHTQQFYQGVVARVRELCLIDSISEFETQGYVAALAGSCY